MGIHVATAPPDLLINHESTNSRYEAQAVAVGTVPAMRKHEEVSLNARGAGAGLRQAGVC